MTDNETMICCVDVIRFQGKTLKGKKYKPLFPYFAKVSSLCSCSCLLHMIYIVCHNMKTDLCLTLITCLTTNWHLSLLSLHLSFNLSFSHYLWLYFFLTTHRCSSDSPLPCSSSVWRARSVSGGVG